jgi:pilus assembly protein Flp/PilA
MHPGRCISPAVYSGSKVFVNWGCAVTLFMKNMMKDMLRKLKEQKGATAVEYALMVLFITVAIALAVTALGTTLSGLFDTMTASL